MKPRSRQFPLTREAAEALAGQIAGEGFFAVGVERVWNRDAWCVQVRSRPSRFGAPAALLSVHSGEDWERTRPLAAPTGADVRVAARYYGELVARDSALQQAVSKIRRRERHRQLHGCPSQNLGGASIGDLELERANVRLEMRRIATRLPAAA